MDIHKALAAYLAISMLSVTAPLTASAPDDAARPAVAGNAHVILSDAQRNEWTSSRHACGAHGRKDRKDRLRSHFRGVYLDRQLDSDPSPWLLHYPQCRTRVRAALRDLAGTAHINLVVVFIGIPDTLRRPAQGNRVGEKIEQWANLSFLDNVATFIDDCHQARVSAELDLADNRWIPYTVDSANHIGAPGKPWWPVASDTPWRESAAWYSQVINYVEARARHPESIALWTMMGNYHLGTAEPVLWDTDGNPAIKSYTEKFVKQVWPAFRASGIRPKGSPIMLPIFSASDYWMARENKRLSAFTNLKKWLVDDLALPPDYWLMTAYPHCDPAPNGRYYFREILDILGPQNASRIVATDLKGPGHESELRDTILSAAVSGSALQDPERGPSGSPEGQPFALPVPPALRNSNGSVVEGSRAEGPASDLLLWHFRKCAEYGFAGWWIWAYQDTRDHQWGLRTLDGRWKPDLLQAIKTAGDHARHQ